MNSSWLTCEHTFIQGRLSFRRKWKSLYFSTNKIYLSICRIVCHAITKLSFIALFKHFISRCVVYTSIFQLVTNMSFQFSFDTNNYFTEYSYLPFILQSLSVQYAWYSEAEPMYSFDLQIWYLIQQSFGWNQIYEKKYYILEILDVFALVLFWWLHRKKNIPLRHHSCPYPAENTVFRKLWQLIDLSISSCQVVILLRSSANANNKPGKLQRFFAWEGSLTGRLPRCCPSGQRWTWPHPPSPLW